MSGNDLVDGINEIFAKHGMVLDGEKPKVEFQGSVMPQDEPIHRYIEITFPKHLPLPLQCAADLHKFIQEKLGENQYYRFEIDPIHGLNTGYLHVFFCFDFGCTYEQYEKIMKEAHRQYCPHCDGELTFADDGGQYRYRCSNCGAQFPYYGTHINP